eukprot:COSAG02_NODE_97_length_37159_cov_37.660335_32_plen_80_part_00
MTARACICASRDDFLLGTAVWGMAYTKLNLQALPLLCQAPEDDPVLNAWRVIYPRFFTNQITLGVEKHLRDFRVAAGLE